MQGEFEAAGDIATGGVFARAIETDAGEAGHRKSHRHTAQLICLNCGTALSGEFCANCGQAVHIHRTLASIGHDLLHGVWHFEGKIWRTLPMLFTRPGTLTRRYIAGERVRFVSPLALFLFSVFLMVATFETIGGPFGGNDPRAVAAAGKLTPAEMTKQRRDKQAEKTRLTAEIDALRAPRDGSDQVATRIERIDKRIDRLDEDIDALEAAEAITSGKFDNPKITSKIHTGIPAFDHRLAYALKEPKLFLYKLQSSAYKYSWALIPISLPFIWLLFPFRRDVGPYDHTIFAIYSLSAMTLGAVLLSVGQAIGLPGGMIATLFAFGPPLHMYKQLRGAYRIGRFAAIWRTAALMLFSLVSAVLFFVVVLTIIAG